MVTIERIKTSDIDSYKFVEELLVSAFPGEERRELELQRDFTDNNPKFYNNIIKEEGNPIGFITYWDFQDFCYIEHFATSPEVRNGGYGRKVMEAMDTKLCSSIVLEVELPKEELSQRRIGFYQRQGYSLWEREYCQPPYRKGDDYLPMYLMVKGNLKCEEDFDRVKEKLYKYVYLVDEIAE